MDTVAEKNKMQRLTVILEDWAEWMRQKPSLGYPERAMVCAGANVQHFDDMCDESDAWVCRTVDTVIKDLTPAQSCAIHRRYLNAVYRFNRPGYSYADALLEAHEQLMKKLPLKGIDFWD